MRDEAINDRLAFQQLTRADSMAFVALRKTRGAATQWSRERAVRTGCFRISYDRSLR